MKTSCCACMMKCQLDSLSSAHQPEAHSNDSPPHGSGSDTDVEETTDALVSGSNMAPASCGTQPIEHRDENVTK